MTKANISNVKRVLNTIVEQIIHITGSNSVNTYCQFHAFEIIRPYMLNETVLIQIYNK